MVDEVYNATLALSSHSAPVHKVRLAYVFALSHLPGKPMTLCQRQLKEQYIVVDIWFVSFSKA